MEAASAFAGPDADDILIELWSFAVDLCEREGFRLIAEHERIRKGRKKVSLAEFQDLKDIEKKYEKLADVWRERYLKLRDYGFHYSDELKIRKLSQ